MLPTKFLFIWPSGFGEDLKKSANQKQELPVVAMFVNESGQNEQSLQRTFHGCFLPDFSSFGQAVLEEKIIQKSTNQKQELSMAAMFVNGSGRNEQFYIGPSIDASHQVSVQLTKRFQRRRFKKKLSNQKQKLPVVAMLMNLNKKSNLYRGPSMNASYKVSVHLAKGFRRRRLKCEKLTDDRCQVMAKAHFAFGKVS